MRYCPGTLMIVLTILAFLGVAWAMTSSISQAVGWALVPVFFGFCYWMLRRRQAETKGSYKYAEGDSGTGAATGGGV